MTSAIGDTLTTQATSVINQNSTAYATRVATGELKLDGRQSTAAVADEQNDAHAAPANALALAIGIDSTAPMVEVC